MGIHEGEKKFLKEKNPNRRYRIPGKGPLPSESKMGVTRQTQIDMMRRVDDIAATGVCGACAGVGKVNARIPQIPGKRGLRTCLGCNGTGRYPISPRGLK